MSTSEYSQSASSERGASVDAEQVERAKREIQGLVQEISELSRSQISPAEFYDAMLNKVVAAMAAPGGGRLDACRRRRLAAGLPDQSSPNRVEG